MRKTLAVALLLLVVAVAPAVAEEKPAAPPTPPPTQYAPSAPQARPNPQPEPAPCALYVYRFIHPRAVEVLARSLKLTDDQKTKVTDMLTRLSSDCQPKVAAQRKAAADYAAVVVDPSSTPTAVVAAADKMMKTELDLIGDYAKAVGALRAVLTPEQAPLLQALLERYTTTYRGQGLPPAMPAPPGPPAGAAQPGAAGK